jgi:hypothetical protein
MPTSGQFADPRSSEFPHKNSVFIMLKNILLTFSEWLITNYAAFFIRKIFLQNYRTQAEPLGRVEANAAQPRGLMLRSATVLYPHRWHKATMG